jgi:hypothetical protein
LVVFDVGLENDQRHFRRRVALPATKIAGQSEAMCAHCDAAYRIIHLRGALAAPDGDRFVAQQGPPPLHQLHHVLHIGDNLRPAALSIPRRAAVSEKVISSRLKCSEIFMNFLLWISY